jgi:bifunctional non-homologous end joining protein LigD
MRLRLVKEPFDDTDYIFELKHDGFRAVAYLYNGECKLISRNMRFMRFDSLRKALAKLPVLDAILDGEIVCLDNEGISRFNHLLNGKQPVFYAFDLLWINGEDIRQSPLLERKQRLSGLIRSGQFERIVCAQHIDGTGKQFFQEICARDLEGIVAKRKLSIYKDDGNGWLKVKNRSYSQMEGRHELLTRKRSQ